MKVFEVVALMESKRDIADIRDDYQKWLKLINMPSKMLLDFIESDIGSKAIKDFGNMPREIQKIRGPRHNNSAARAILKMRDVSLLQWTSKEINWMYRQLNFIKTIKNRPGDWVSGSGNKKKPTDKLLAAWAWGHIPNTLIPNKFGIDDETN